MAGLSTKKALWVGAALALVLGLLTLSGCGDSYPQDLTYPPRTDPIVDYAALPKTQPTHLDAPGQLKQWIDAIPSRGGKVLDPTAGIEKHQLALVNEALSRGQFDISEEDARAMGLVSRPNKDDAKKTLEARRDALTERIKAITDTMAKIGPQLNKALEQLFGRPASPKVSLDDSSLDEALDDPKEFRLDPATLAEGSKLYRRHCLHCHGLTGDGRGPTGPWVNPHPRDYRLGIFKFTSSAEPQGSRKARRDDLLRTLKMGIEGTSMPSFALLDEQTELQPLISYVMHLSLRGQVEMEVIKEAIGGSADPSLDVARTAGERLTVNWGQWKSTDKRPIKVEGVPSYADKTEGQLSADERKRREESIRAGFVLFTTGAAQCRSCHNDFGRANDYRFDYWGTIVRPANLTAGTYRGGRRPLDLYYRIYGGVNGAGMSGFIGSALTAEQIWDVVNFLEAMPYKKMLPEDVRDQVYGKE
jgi:mono/diheme cytochrome c family protein